MKISEMNDEQILKLSEDEIETLVKLECAEQGVRLEPAPPELENRDMTKDVLAFGIKELSDKIFFTSKEAADKVLAVLREVRMETKLKRYDWRTGYDVEWLENFDTELEVTQQFFYKKDLVDSREAALVKRKNQEDSYTQEKREYEASREKRRTIADNIWSWYYAAKKRADDFSKYSKIFQDYFTLADGDRKKARAFFDKAYTGVIPQDAYDKLFPPENMPAEEAKEAIA